MCGICGTYGVADADTRVARMLSILRHRGPDDEGTYVNGPVTLGHRRLSIVDLSANGHQPLVTDDQRLAAVVNGEIYNYPELRRELEAEGANFQSSSDSEIVLHGYRAWGTASFERFNGMFAFGLFDAASGRLFLVRDRLGIKPVYYHVAADGSLAFASEIKALIGGSGARSWRIDPTALGQYLTNQNMLGGKSLFEGVTLLAPGHYLEVSDSSSAEHAYWRPDFKTAAGLDFKDAVCRFKDVFDGAVTRHLMSDVPVASYLSGGFDSTLVASGAAKRMKTPPETYTGYFADGGWYDERDGARLVSNALKSEAHEIRITADDFRDAVDAVISALDEPRMGMGSVPQYIVAASVAKQHKVILTGHGGDELFSGYPVFKLAYLLASMVSRPRAAFAALKAVRASEAPHLGYFGLQRLMRGADAHFMPTLFSPREQSAGLLPEVAHAVASAKDDSVLTRIAEQSQTAYERILRTYLEVYLPGLLVVEDKISMAHALESRTPFLDNKLVDLALLIPEDVKLNDGQLKAIIKAAARDALPPELFKLPKRGFPTPLAQWLRGPLSGWLRQRISAPDSALTRIFKPAYLEASVENYLRSWRRSYRPLDEIQTHRIWMLLSLESWLRCTESNYGVRLEMT